MRIGEVELKTIDIVTFLGMIITLFTSILNLFQNKKSIYINSITRYRISWINTLRMYVANLKELSNTTNLYISTKDGSNKIKYRRELDKVVSLIKMHLNFVGDFDNKFLSKIEELRVMINSYLLLNYYKNSINNVKNNEELINKFNEVVDVISERRVLEDLLNIGRYNKNTDNFGNVKVLNLLDLKKKTKLLYLDDNDLISQSTHEVEYIIQECENKIEKLNEEIDEIVQIYLKAEWIRCKRETRMWPFSIYNEEKIIKQLQEKYQSSIK